MIKITKETDYAVLLMVEIAKQQNEEAKPLNAAVLAERSRVPQNMVSKTLKSLAQANLLCSVRGAYGGYLLNNDANSITMQAIVEALEGPIALTECIDEEHSCCAADKEGCNISPYWHQINQAICSALSSISLEVLMQQSSVPSSAPLVQQLDISVPINLSQRQN
jgi:FeS assembly SUF system regulator